METYTRKTHREITESWSAIDPNVKVGAIYACRDRKARGAQLVVVDSIEAGGVKYRQIYPDPWKPMVRRVALSWFHGRFTPTGEMML